MLRSSVRFLSSSKIDLQSAYKILGFSSAQLSTQITPDHVRQKYLKLARLHHPDVSNGDDTKMKQINLAYEVVQSLGFSSTVAHDQTSSSSSKKSQRRSTADGDGFGQDEEQNQDSYNGKRARQKKHRSNLGDAANWNTRPEFEWKAAIFDVNEQETMNPRNHPNSFNRHFSFTDDSNIFRMVRSGATMEEVARSMGRTALAIEARMNSAQFKLRIQKMLKADDYKQKTSRSFEEEQDDDDDERNVVHDGDGELDNETMANGRKRRNSFREGKGNFKMQARNHYTKQVHPSRDTVYRNPGENRGEDAEPLQPGDLPFLHPEEIPDEYSSDFKNSDDRFFDQFSSKRLASAHGRSYSHLMKHVAKGNPRKQGTGGIYTGGRKFY